MMMPVRLKGMQKGVALFISLVLLLVLTIVGVSAVQTTSLEERMARNARDRMLAFQAAEAALSDAEVELRGMTTTNAFGDGSNGLWSAPELGADENWRNPAIWTDNRSIIAPTTLDGVSEDEPSRYMIEHLATVVRSDESFVLSDPYAGGGAATIEIFRVTARGVGGSANSRVLLQSTFGWIMN
jgi:type IV pilus assembly protein PilX